MKTRNIAKTIILAVAAGAVALGLAGPAKRLRAPRTATPLPPPSGGATRNTTTASSWRAPT